MFFGVFTAEEVDSAGDKGSGDTTIFMQRHSLRSVCSIDEVCFWEKAKLLLLGLHPPPPPPPPPIYIIFN